MFPKKFIAHWMRFSVIIYHRWWPYLGRDGLLSSFDGEVYTCWNVWLIFNKRVEVSFFKMDHLLKWVGKKGREKKEVFVVIMKRLLATQGEEWAPFKKWATTLIEKHKSKSCHFPHSFLFSLQPVIQILNLLPGMPVYPANQLTKPAIIPLPNQKNQGPLFSLCVFQHHYLMQLQITTWVSGTVTLIKLNILVCSRDQRL